MPRPRDRRHDNPMLLAEHARRVGLQERERGPQVKRPPPPASLTGILARATPSAHTTTMLLPRARADRHHDRLELDADVLDHRPLDPEQHLPYASQAHAATVSFTSVPALRSQNRKSTAACAAPLTLVGAPCAPTSSPQSAPGRRCQAARTPASTTTPRVPRQTFEALLDRRR